MFSMNIFVVVTVYGLMGIGFTKMAVYIFKDDALPTMTCVYTWPFWLFIFSFFDSGILKQKDW